MSYMFMYGVKFLVLCACVWFSVFVLFCYSLSPYVICYFTSCLCVSLQILIIFSSLISFRLCLVVLSSLVYLVPVVLDVVPLISVFVPQFFVLLFVFLSMFLLRALILAHLWIFVCLLYLGFLDSSSAFLLLCLSAVISDPASLD